MQTSISNHLCSIRVNNILHSDVHSDAYRYTDKKYFTLIANNFNSTPAFLYENFESMSTKWHLDLYHQYFNTQLSLGYVIIYVVARTDLSRYQNNVSQNQTQIIPLYK